MVGLRMEDSSIVYTVYAVLMVVAGTVLYCCSKIMDEYLAPKHPAHFWIMDYELSFRVACAFGIVSSFFVHHADVDDMPPLVFGQTW